MTMKSEPQVSVSTTSGTYSNTMARMPLRDALKEALANAPEAKEECWLISNGYSDKHSRYTRAEHNFTTIDTILLDIDNPEGDPLLLEKFKEEYKRYCYFLWETASSTKEKPKFRVILLLDEPVEWINEPEKYTKSAILQLFSKWTDDKASWYFTPTKGKLSTFKCHEGEPFPSSQIKFLVNLNKQLAKALQHSDSYGIYKIQKRDDPDGWRKMSAVRKCLESPISKDRDSSLNAACYAMANNGYKDKIPEFLDEVQATIEDYEWKKMKDKFRHKYR